MHKDWCGRPCADCTKPCSLDENIPCSPDCELLNKDGSIDIEKCKVVGCDAYLYNLYGD